MQIVARAYGDLTSLKVAEWIEEEFGGFVRHRDTEAYFISATRRAPTFTFRVHT